jgi:hypothetical protein
MLPIPARVAGRRKIPDPTIVVATSNIPVIGPIALPVSPVLFILPRQRLNKESKKIKNYG